MSSTPLKASDRKASAPHRGPPYIGALLRLSWQAARARILRELHEAGFGDLHPPHLNVMQYPPPDGARPGDLAERANMTKQAMNYLLGQLETFGYIERRTAPGSSRRLVYVTERGRAAVAVAQATMQRLETEWAARIGDERFTELIDTLKQLAASP